MKKILSSTFIVLFLFYFNSYADIESISGIVSDGETIVISGSGFGTKTTAPPATYLHDNIESGTNGASFAATDWVNDVISTPPKVDSVYSTDQAHSGSKSILFDFTDQVWCQNRFDSGANGGLSPIYFTTWVYIERNDEPEYSNDVQWKSWRVSSSPGYSTNDETTTSIILNDWFVHPANTWFGSSIGTYNGSLSDMTSYYGVIAGPESDSILIGEWQRFEMYLTMSSAPNTADGTFLFRRVGQPAITNSLAMTTHDADDGLWRYIIIGQLYNDNDGDTEDHAKIYYDDIYIDNSQARVEIGNNSVFADCTHREIQIPTVWADGEVSAVIKLGTFTVEDTTYLFIVDSDGNSSDGYEITIASDTTPPTVTAFAIPATYTSIPVPVTTFTATDDTAVTGYIVTGSSTAPAYTASGWTPSPPTELDFLSEGANTVYAWAKDAAGLVSLSATDDCTVTLPEPGITWEVQPTWSITWEDQPTWSITWE